MLKYWLLFNLSLKPIICSNWESVFIEIIQNEFIKEAINESFKGLFECYELIGDSRLHVRRVASSAS